jgi:hypothetical protein
MKRRSFIKNNSFAAAVAVSPLLLSGIAKADVSTRHMLFGPLQGNRNVSAHQIAL